MAEIPLPALEGSNPLGYLAALGVLDALSAATPAATLRWTNELVPCAVIDGFGGDLDDLLDVLDRDRQEWVNSPLLGFPQDAPALTDAKPDEKQLRGWFEFVADLRGSEAAAAHLCAIVAEDTFDGGGGRAKPTHLHFSAGQQHWLRMVRELAGRVARDPVQEAARRPWPHD